MFHKDWFGPKGDFSVIHSLAEAQITFCSTKDPNYRSHSEAASSFRAENLDEIRFAPHPTTRKKSFAGTLSKLCQEDPADSHSTRAAACLFCKEPGPVSLHYVSRSPKRM